MTTECKGGRGGKKHPSSISFDNHCWLIEWKIDVDREPRWQIGKLDQLIVFWKSCLRYRWSTQKRLRFDRKKRSRGEISSGYACWSKARSYWHARPPEQELNTGWMRGNSMTRSNYRMYFRKNPLESKNNQFFFPVFSWMLTHSCARPSGATGRSV